MPPKKGGKGGKRVGAGRKDDGQGTGRDSTREERSKYFREYRAKEREQEKVPSARAVKEMDLGEERGKGRPALDPEAGPMKGEVLLKYKMVKQRETRKKERISKVRRDAVSRRADRGGKEELLREGSKERELEVSLDEEMREEEVELEKPKASSVTNFNAKLRAVKELMIEMTLLEKVDVTVRILTLHDMDDEKLGIRISSKDAKAHLAQGISQLSAYKVREKAQHILDIVESHAEAERMLASLLQDQVYQQDVAVSHLTAAGVQVDDGFLTRRQLARKITMEEYRRVTSTRHQENRDISIKMAISIAKKCNFTLERYSDLTVFAECMGCSLVFAKKVLQAVGKGDTKSLFKRSRKKDWPGVLREFLDKPMYSRLVPGNDTVSMYYGHRVPKVLLLTTRTKVLQEFKADHPDCPFSVRTLLREMPANYVTMTARDFGRNACVTHTNFRHLVRHLLNQGILQDTLNSCRFLASKSLCSSYSSFNPLSPITWQECCAVQECDKCPGFTLTCPREKEGVMVDLAQWENKFCTIKQKKIHSLFSTSISIKDLVSKFNKELTKITGHIYRAARIWDTYKVESNVWPSYFLPAQAAQ